MSVEGICFIAGMGSVLVVLPLLSFIAAVMGMARRHREKTGEN